MSKRTFEFFSFYDSAGMERRMEDMAKQGWLPEKMGSLFWHWKSMEPQNLHFSVTYFADASEFDPRPTEEQEIFAEFCARSGWTLLLRSGQMQVFTSDRENPLPIETDAAVQVETVHKTMKKSVLATQLVMLALCLWQLVFSWLRFDNDPVGFLSSPSSLCMVPAWLLLLAECLCELGFYLRWYRRAKRLAAETGEFLRIKTSRWMSLVLLIAAALIMLAGIFSSAVALGGILLWFALMPLLFLCANGVKRFMKRHQFSRRTNRFITLSSVAVITIAAMMLLGIFIIRFDGFDTKKAIGTYNHHGFEMKIYDDPLPLTVEELTGAEGLWSKEERGQSSFLLANRDYHQDSIPSGNNDAPGLSYTIIEVKAPFLYELCLAQLLTEDEDFPEEYRDYYKAVDAAPWQANAAYRKHSHDGTTYRRHVLCYDNRIVIIVPDWELTHEQMSLVGKKLG